MALGVPSMANESSLIPVLRMPPKVSPATFHAKTLLNEYMSGNIWKMPGLTTSELEAYSWNVLSHFSVKCFAVIQMVLGGKDERSVYASLCACTTPIFCWTYAFRRFGESLQLKSAKIMERYENPKVRSKAYEHAKLMISQLIPPKTRVVTDTELLTKYKRQITQLVNPGNGIFYAMGAPILVFDDGSMYRSEEEFGYLLMVIDQKTDERRWALLYRDTSTG